MYCCYILKSIKTNKYYVGCTENVNKRLQQHNSGLSTYTRNERPWKLIYIEEFNTRVAARQRESQIKRWKSRKAIERLFIKFNNKIEDPRFRKAESGLH